MKHMIRFCVDEDELSDVLETAVRAYGFDSHEAYVNEFIEKPVVDRPATKRPADDEDYDEDYDEFDAGPWDKQIAVDYLGQLTDDAVKAICLLISSGGVVAVKDMRDYLQTDSLRGIFSTFGAAVRHTDGLSPGDRPFFKTYRPHRAYVMNADVCKIFREALEEQEIEYMIEDADAFFAALEKRKARRR